MDYEVILKALVWFDMKGHIYYGSLISPQFLIHTSTTKYAETKPVKPGSFHSKKIQTQS